MLDENTSSKKEFDQFASSYRQALDSGLSLSGESSEYFAQQRVALLKKRFGQMGARIESILDFGCGTGTTIPILQEVFRTQNVTGIDVSPRSIAIAKKSFPQVSFYDVKKLPANVTFDLIYTNGVFHHIAKKEHATWFQFIAAHLANSGHFAYWENNPFSPAARWVMSRIPFDKEAEMVWPMNACNLMENVNLSVISTSYHFIFPGIFSPLRFLECRMSALPLGAQYLVLAKKLS